MNQQIAPIQQIKNALTTKESISKMAMAAGFESNNEKGRSKAMACAASVFSEIEKSAGSKQDLTGCSPDSIVQCATDAMRYDVPIDGRQMAHLVKYGNKATFQIGYRAYLAKMKEHYPDADFAIEPVFNGDQLDIWEENGVQHYSLKKGSVFNDGAENLQGVLVAVTYTDNGRLIRKVNAVSKTRIERAKNAAKQDFIWRTDYIEKAKAAAIKATFKHMFAALQGLQDMIRYDNENHYDPNKGLIRVESSAGSIVENINSQITHAKPEVDETGGLELEADDQDDVIEAEAVSDDDVFPGDLPDGVTREQYEAVHGGS